MFLLKSYTMYAKINEFKPYQDYKTVWSYSQPEESYRQPKSNDPTEQYLHYVDEILQRSQPAAAENTFNLVSLVFANQTAQHSLSSGQFAHLIQERRRLAEIHKANIKFRLDDLISAKSIAKMFDPQGEGKRLTNVERQILDLDKQERDIQTSLWKDTLELRTKLLEERSLYHATARRIQMLRGGAYGAG